MQTPECAWFLEVSIRLFDSLASFAIDQEAGEVCTQQRLVFRSLQTSGKHDGVCTMTLSIQHKTLAHF